MDLNSQNRPKRQIDQKSSVIHLYPFSNANISATVAPIRSVFFFPESPRRLLSSGTIGAIVAPTWRSQISEIPAIYDNLYPFSNANNSATVAPIRSVFFFPPKARLPGSQTQQSPSGKRFRFPRYSRSKRDSNSQNRPQREIDQKSSGVSAYTPKFSNL